MSNDEHNSSDEKVFRVRAGTDCKQLGMAITGMVEREKPCTLEFIGAGACNQATKAVIVANGILAKHGHYVSTVPRFVTREIRGDTVSAIQFTIIRNAIVR